ncbi:MAG: hypothetical protein WC915_00815 [archaeon]|jgi:hypothetical protein
METIFEIKIQNNENELILVKFVPDEFYTCVIDFVVSYRSKINGVFYEIIRFDGSRKEKSHVHKFYLNKKQKQVIEKDFSFETIEWCIKVINENWHNYKIKFASKKYL